MQTQWLQRQQGRIAYDDQGQGPLVLCVPSLGDVRAEYRFLVPKLVTAGYRVVTTDMRGHGESSTGWPDYSVAGIGDDILALIDHLDAGPALVVATSAAAGGAVWAAAEGPDRFRGLVLVGAFVHDAMPPWIGQVLFTPLLTWPWGRAFWRRYYRSLYPSAQPEDFEDYLAALDANLKEPGRMQALRRTTFTSKQAAGDRLDQVQAPVLVMMGSADPDFKDAAAEGQWVAQHLNGKLYVVEGAGHYPHAERPDEAATQILSFFQAALGGTP